MGKIRLAILSLFLVSFLGCPPSQFISDRNMMSAVEAFVPETEIMVDGKPCHTVDGEEGACSAIREAGDTIRFKIKLLSESSEVSWKSNCRFDYNSKNINEGSFVTDKKSAYITLKNIPEPKQVCTVGILVLDTDREEEEVMPANSGSISMVHIIVGDPNYVSLPNTQIGFKDDEVYVKASRFTKDLQINGNGEFVHLKKINEFEFDKPPSGRQITFRTQSDIGRRNKIVVVTK